MDKSWSFTHAALPRILAYISLNHVGWSWRPFVKREQNKQSRRQAILAAAEKLIRENESVDFSVSDLATTAGVSVATLYNLVGTKTKVLYELLNQSMDKIDAVNLSSPKNDPFEVAIEAGDIAVNVFTSDPRFFRPLYRFLLGAVEPVQRPAFMNRGFTFWRQRLSVLHTEGYLPPGVTVIEYARDFQLFFAGTLDLWVQNELTEAQFRAQVKHGCILRLLALGHGKSREDLLKQLRRCSPSVREPLTARR